MSPLSLHDALPISRAATWWRRSAARRSTCARRVTATANISSANSARSRYRSEEHTSELQSPYELVCRLPLEKKNGFSTSSRFLCKRRRSSQPRPATCLPSGRTRPASSPRTGGAEQLLLRDPRTSPRCPLFPYTTLFRSHAQQRGGGGVPRGDRRARAA